MTIHSPDEVAKTIDHTLLKPDAEKSAVERLCKEAIEYRFASVCINPYYVPLAADCLKGSDVKVCTVIGFPLGADAAEVKAFEAKRAVDDGAQELDMVMNVSAMKSGEFDRVEEDIRSVVEAVPEDILVKVILETCCLSAAEIRKACTLALNAGADFVKTSTGFGSGGATLEAIRIMKETVGDRMGIKASGGIRDFDACKAMLEAGATRIGTSSGVKIVQGK